LSQNITIKQEKMKKRLCLILLLSLQTISLLSYSQADSLILAIRNSKNDTVKLNNIYEQLSSPKYIADTSYDKACIEFIQKAKSIKWTTGVLKGNSITGTRFYYRGNFDNAIEYFNDNISFDSSVTSNMPFLANSHKMLAGSYFNKGESEKAISEATRAINLYKTLNDTVGWAKTINLLGGIYWNLGKLDIAAQNIYKALKLREKMNDSLGVAHSYNNIGLIYDTQGKQDDALKMYKKALEIYEKLGNSVGIGRASNNIAIILKNKKQYTESLQMFLKSYEIDLKRNNIDDQGKTLSNIGELYISIGNPEQSISYLQKAKQIFEKNSNENGLAAVLINLGKAYLLKGNNYKAKESFSKGLKLAQKLNSLEWQKEAHEGIYNSLKSIGDYSNALNHFEKFKNYDDSLKSISNLNTIDKLKIEYETEKKENQIKLLQKSNEVNRLRFEKQRNLNLLLISISILIGVILVILYFYQRKLKKDKVLLQEMNSEILIQKEEIETQRDMLEVNFNELNQHKMELAKQTEKIERQNNELKYANHRITEGLEYASMIQKSLFSNPKELEAFFSNQSFLYLPKDYVGGDLYWHHVNDERVIFSIADCTGHGVAGAFMSIMAISFLKDAISIYNLEQPDEIASYLYQQLIKSKTTPFDSNLILGIDFIICKFNKDSNTLTYSGNKLSFEYIDLSRNHVSVRPRRKVNKDLGTLYFENHKLDISNKGRLFFYTDGFPDQISEVKHKKMGRNEFISQLKNTIEQPIHLQVEHVNKFMQRWKGNYEQIDDATLLAIEI
jgi:tetratricopeptide (TPR) repeat protein